MTIADQIHDFGKRARAAARQLRQCTAEQKNAGLRAMADEIVAAEPELLAANAQDVEKATASGLSAAMIASVEMRRGRFLWLVILALPLRSIFNLDRSSLATTTS